MKKIAFLVLAICLNVNVFAQESERFYATMARQDARELKQDAPHEIDILKESGNEAAVLMSANAAEELHDRILVHGPGYIFKGSYEDAVSAIK